MFNPDKPITSSDDDALGRKNVANALGDGLLADSNKESHVIGIYGKWGSGKTSFINMALEHVEKKSIDFAKNEKPVIINFNPWNFSNQNQLINQFFNQLSNDFSRDNSKWLKSAGKMLKTYSLAISPLSIVPPFTGFAISTSIASGIVGKAAELVGHHVKKSTEELKDEICKNLLENDGRIIIVIDDIDRLNAIEITQIFQLVKSIADFPNTTYILTFDKEVVSNALETEQCGNGNQYLEKIVQIPFELPEIPKSELLSLLMTQLDEIIEKNPHDDFNGQNYINMLNSGFFQFFKNIRDINRYINVLNFNYEVIKDEVNVIDFIAITAIQVFLPELYQEIKNNRHVFVNSTSVSNKEPKDIDKAICNEIFEMYDNKQKPFLQNFLSILFPRLNFHYKKTNYSPTHYISWRKNRLICSESFFDIYFRFALPNEKISQAEMKILLSKGNDIEFISESIQNIIENGKSSDFLYILPDYIENIPYENIESFVAVIIDIGDLFENKAVLFNINLIIDSLLAKIESQNERYIILEKSINNATHSLYTIVNEINSIELNENEQLIRSEKIHKLEKLACEKFNIWLKEGKLIRSPYFYYILQLVKQWGSEKEHEKYMKSIVSDDIALSKLISNMIGIYEISTAKTNWVRLISNLGKLTELNYVKERIIEIKESANYNDLSKKEKNGLEICLKEIENQEITEIQSETESS